MGYRGSKKIESDYLESYYLVELLHTPVSRDEISLSVFVYKEKYTLVYKVVGREVEVFSIITDEKTIKLYRNNAYEISVDGKFTIPIE